MRNRSKLLALTILLLLARAVPAVASSAGFRSPEHLREHYEKHGAEFGHVSAEQYLRLAQGLRDAPPGRDILISERPAGFAKYDRNSNSFGAYDRNGTIRTFFKPNDGERYFRRQARIRDRK